MPPNLTVQDQFGERLISKFITTKLCTPAYATGGPIYKDPDIRTAVTAQTISGGTPGNPVVAAMSEPLSILEDSIRG